MENLIILEDDKNSKVFSKQISYDEQTTIQDVIDHNFPGYEDIIVFDREKSKPCLKLDFYFHEGDCLESMDVKCFDCGLFKHFSELQRKGDSIKKSYCGRHWRCSSIGFFGMDVSNSK